MRTLSTIVLFLLFSNSALAQFAVIQDKDGYCNVRAEPSANSKLIERLANNEVVYCFEKEGNWWSIDYGDDGENHGYIYMDRVRMLSEFTSLPVTVQKSDEVRFQKDSMSIRITTAAFQKGKHRLQHFKDNPRFIEKIDGKEFWGTDGELPKLEYKQIEINLGATIFNLPSKALHNLYNPSLHDTQASYNRNTNTLYIYAENSDGAGGYEVLWIIRNGRYWKRLVCHGF